MGTVRAPGRKGKATHPPREREVRRHEGTRVRGYEVASLRAASSGIRHGANEGLRGHGRIAQGAGGLRAASCELSEGR